MNKNKNLLEPLINKTGIERDVREWVNEKLADGSYTTQAEVIKELLEKGCVSGMVSHLITFYQTSQFFAKYGEEISQILSDLLVDTRLSIAELFGDKWDKGDPLAMDFSNRNLLAWFGFEETARKILEAGSPEPA